VVACHDSVFSESDELTLTVRDTKVLDSYTVVADFVKLSFVLEPSRAGNDEKFCNI